MRFTAEKGDKGRLRRAATELLSLKDKVRKHNIPLCETSFLSPLFSFRVVKILTIIKITCAANSPLHHILAQ